MAAAIRHDGWRALVVYQPMISETRGRLKEWGKWASGGEPGLSSMFRAMFGRGGAIAGEMPVHIQEIDHIVCTARPELRIVLIKVYAAGGTMSDKAIELGLNRITLKRRCERAEYYVHSRLDALPLKSAIFSQN
jgi:hypothetical protein